MAGTDKGDISPVGATEIWWAARSVKVAGAGLNRPWLRPSLAPSEVVDCSRVYCVQSETAAMITTLTSGVKTSKDDCLEHAQSSLDVSPDTDSGYSSPDSTSVRLASLLRPDSIPEDDELHHGFSEPQLPIVHLLPPARHISEPAVTDLLVSSLTATHCEQASFITDVLNRVPQVTTAQIYCLALFWFLCQYTAIILRKQDSLGERQVKNGKFNRKWFLSRVSYTCTIAMVLTVRLSVCLSRCGIISTNTYLRSCSLYHTVVQGP